MSAAITHLGCGTLFKVWGPSLIDCPRAVHSIVVRASTQGGVRFPTASHQRRKKWEVCASQLGTWH